MITRVIEWSLLNRPLVLIATAFLVVAGLVALRATPVDAIPDLSDVQVVVRTAYAGQAPKVVEQQVTYPLSTAMLAVPKAKTVRGYSFFGDSFVYVIFDEGTDPYWGAFTGTGIAVAGVGRASRRGATETGARCHRCRLGLRVRVGGP